MDCSFRYATAAQMKEIDRLAIEKYGVPAKALMESAGSAVAEEVIRASPAARALILCGYGNNGGDGFVVARLLAKGGFDPAIFLIGRPRPFSRETEDNFKSILDMGISPSAIYDNASLDRAFKDIGPCGMVVDALFGIGIRGRLDELYARLIDDVNALGADVTAVDLPSGLDADAGTPCPVAIKAARTVTFTAAKAGFKNPAAAQFTGVVTVADIGVPVAAVEEVLGK
jgi:NAD(P)H-hydrate epimerase